MAETFSDIAHRVTTHWDAVFASPNPLLEPITEWYGMQYPRALDGRPRRAQNQGLVMPDTDFEECLANAKAYAGPHLKQFAAALDHTAARQLRDALSPGHEVLVVDVGCAAGILGLFTDRSGFAHYVGVDTNEWMRLLARAVFESTLNDITLQESQAMSPDYGTYGPFVSRHQYTVGFDRLGRKNVGSITDDRPTFVIHEGIDNHVGWLRYVENVAGALDLTRPGGRPITVLVVMNHLLFQMHDVPQTVISVLDKCRQAAALRGVQAYLVSIEPGTLYKPDRLGTQGFDSLIAKLPASVTRLSVAGVGAYLTGNSRGDAAVRILRF